MTGCGRRFLSTAEEPKPKPTTTTATDNRAPGGAEPKGEFKEPPKSWWQTQGVLLVAGCLLVGSGFFGEKPYFETLGLTGKEKPKPAA